MAKKVLITGANGFIGTALQKYFKKKYPSFKIFEIDVKIASPSRRLIQCRLTNLKETAKVVSSLKPDYIFHLAGGRTTSEQGLLRGNVLTTNCLLKAVKQVDRYDPCIIIPGSAAEYGLTRPAGKLIKETISAQPVSLYGYIKYMQTSLGLMYVRLGLNVRIARIFNICGYGMSPALALGQFARQIALIERKRGPAVIQTGNLKSKRDYLDVSDVCSAMVKIAQRGKAGEIYNVCSGKSFAIQELLDRLIHFAQDDNIVVRSNNSSAPGVNVSVGSCAKIKNVVGWKPEIDIDQSLKNTVQYYRQLLSKK